MILTCPECSARYIVDPKALLPSGRLVRCAKCRHSWKEAAPDLNIPQVDVSEAEGPEITDATQEIQKPETQTPAAPDKKASAAPEPAVHETTIIEDEFAIARARRKKRPRPIPKGSNLPALQNHKHGDILWGWYGLGSFIVIIVASFLSFQSTISEAWPPSKILYRSLGMEDSGLGQAAHGGEKTQPEIPLTELFKIEDTVPSKVINGQVVTLKVKGNIANLTRKTLPLPLLSIALKDDHGQVIREWTFKSSAATISEGEKIPFSTSLPNPPEDATSISVTFVEK